MDGEMDPETVKKLAASFGLKTSIPNLKDHLRVIYDFLTNNRLSDRLLNGIKPEYRRFYRESSLYHLLETEKIN